MSAGEIELSPLPPRSNHVPFLEGETNTSATK